eukprot:SAG31_NODE_4092_length_3600_cov_3.905109_2_plen_72_part_00
MYAGSLDLVHGPWSMVHGGMELGMVHLRRHGPWWHGAWSMHTVEQCGATAVPVAETIRSTFQEHTTTIPGT